MARAAARRELGRIDQDIDARAEQIRSNYRSRAKAIAGDADLAPHAREKRSREVREQATEQMRELREGYAKERGAAILSQQQVMLGTAPSDATKLVAFRDARARAEALRHVDQATEAMRQAVRDDDRGMQEAIASTALDRGWFKAWRAAPELADGVEALAKLRGGTPDNFFRFTLSG